MTNVFTELFGFGKKELRAERALAEHELAVALNTAKSTVARVRQDVSAALVVARADVATAVQAAEPEIKAAVDSELAKLAAKILAALA